MPPALTTREIDTLRASQVALDGFKKAKASGEATEIAKARRRLEDILTELEKHRDPNTEALRQIKKSLARPIDLMAKRGRF